MGKVDQEYLDKLHTDNPDCPFVQKETCQTRTCSLRWVAVVLFGVLGVFLALIVYASGQASSANAQYTDMATKVVETREYTRTEVTEVKSQLKAHEAKQVASQEAICDKLDELKRELADQRKEQRALLEKILELQIEVAKKTVPSP